MSLTICLWSLRVFQLWASVLWGRLLSAIAQAAVFTHSLLPNSQPSFGIYCKMLSFMIFFNFKLFFTCHFILISYLEYGSFIFTRIHLGFECFVTNDGKKNNAPSTYVYDQSWWSDLSTHSDCAVNRGNGCSKFLPTKILLYIKQHS